MSQSTITLSLRGRGRRTFLRDQPLLISPGGDGQPRLSPAADAQPGDFVGITYGGTWPAVPSRLPRPSQRPRRGTEKEILLPESMTDDLAFFLGAYFSEGHGNQSNWSIVITNSVDSVLERVQAACESVFGLPGRIVHPPARCPYFVVASKRLVEFLKELGCGTRASEKRVPSVVTHSTRHGVVAFLQGAALDAYTTCHGLPRWAICLDSATGINDLQDLVTRLGIPNAQIAKWNEEYEKHYFELYMPGRAGQAFSRLVPFLEPDKHARALEFQKMEITGADWTDVIPGIRGQEVYDLIPRGRPGRSGNGTGRRAFRHLCDKRTRHVTRASIMRAQGVGAALPAWLVQILEQQVRFVPVDDGTSQRSHATRARP